MQAEALGRECVRGLLRVWRGLRNGSAYATRIRLPHALLMVFLFSPGDLRTKIAQIVRLTVDHAGALAKFVALYKGTTFLTDTVLDDAADPYKLRRLAAGAFCGALVWRRMSPVHNQIVLYVMARVVVAGLRILSQTMAQRQHDAKPPGHRIGGPADIRRNAQGMYREMFRILAVASWSLVMYIYETQPRTLPTSLRRSMDALYGDADNLNPIMADVGAADPAAVAATSSASWGAQFAANYLPSVETVVVAVLASWLASTSATTPPPGETTTATTARATTATTTMPTR